MKVEKQKLSLSVLNYDQWCVNDNFQKHTGVLAGGCRRGLILGSSGSGKTNLMLSLIDQINGLRFENIYVYSKSLYQPKYEYLRKLFHPIEEIGYFEFEDGAEIIPPNEAKINSLFLFDDVVCEKGSIIRDYYVFSRHRGIDCFYLAQTYSAIAKQLVRDNANLIILFKQDNTNLKHVYEDHVQTDMSFDKFKELCLNCWQEKFGFIVIDKNSDLNSGRYRKNFDNFIII